MWTPPASVKDRIRELISVDPAVAVEDIRTLRDTSTLKCLHVAVASNNALGSSLLRAGVLEAVLQHLPAYPSCVAESREEHWGRVGLTSLETYHSILSLLCNLTFLKNPPSLAQEKRMELVRSEAFAAMLYTFSDGRRLLGGSREIWLKLFPTFLALANNLAISSMSIPPTVKTFLMDDRKLRTALCRLNSYGLTCNQAEHQTVDPTGTFGTRIIHSRTVEGLSELCEWEVDRGGPDTPAILRGRTNIHALLTGPVRPQRVRLEGLKSAKIGRAHV